jgi:hypothetical protein
MPRRIRSDATGTYLICDSCGTGTKLGPADTHTDETTNETIVGVREHMPRGAADS